MSEHTAFEELAAGYALHALEPAEEQTFVDHLASCANCERALGRHERVTARLADLSEADQPPAALWATIQASLGPAAPSGDRPALRPVRPVGEGSHDTPAPASSRLSLAHRLRSPIAAVAAALLAAAIGIGTWQAVDRPARSGPDVAALTSSCRNESGCDVVTMTPGSHERVVLLVRGQRARMVTPGLAHLSGDQTYVLWQLSRNGRPIGVSAFSAAHKAARTVSLRIPVAKTAKFAVSREHGDTIPSHPTKVIASTPAPA
jgi:anti-sigma-K factor RskA